MNKLFPQYLMLGIPIIADGKQAFLFGIDVSEDSKQIPLPELMESLHETAIASGYTVATSVATSVVSEGGVSPVVGEKTEYVKPAHNEKIQHKIGCVVRRVQFNANPKPDGSQFTEVLDLYPIWQKNTSGKPNKSGVVKDWSFGEFHYSTFYMNTEKEVAAAEAWLAQVGLTLADIPLYGHATEGLTQTAILRDHDAPKKFECYFKDVLAFEGKNWWEAYLLAENTAVYKTGYINPKWNYPRLVIEPKV